jgi:Ca2+-transporting ATPase
MQEEMPFLMSLCVAYWKRKIMSSGCKGIVQKSSACLTTGFVTTICTDLARKLISQDELEETRKAIRDCQTAGVNVKFISQDDISVVRAAAIEFGILTENSEAAMLKGEDFRNFSEAERIGMVDQITAIGNCLPSGKLLLMQCPKKKGNVVALTGANDLRDTPALRQADIGFVKADWGTKMARDYYLDLMV